MTCTINPRPGEGCSPTTPDAQSLNHMNPPVSLPQIDVNRHPLTREGDAPSSQRAYPLSAIIFSNCSVVVIEVDVLGTQAVPPHKFLVAGRPLVLSVTRQHALDAHAHTLDVLDGTPALLAEKVEADDAVGVDVRVHRDGAVVQLREDNFGRL